MFKYAGMCQIELFKICIPAKWIEMSARAVLKESNENLQPFVTERKGVS